MGWSNLCSWASCLGDKQDGEEQGCSERPTPRIASRHDLEEVSEKKLKIAELYMQPPPPPPSVISEEPKPQARMDRDLPPVPPIPPTVYELGMASPRTGVTRSNSRSSLRTSASVKSRKRRTQILEQRKSIISPPTDFRKVEGALSGTDSSGLRAPDVATSRRTSIHRPLTLSIHEDDGKLEPLPVFTRGSTPENPSSFDDTPIACNEEDIEEEDEEYYEDDEESLKALHRRSDSAPIPLPLRSSSTHHTIRRKPVTPKTSLSFQRPHTVASTTLETYAEQLGTTESPIELYVPAFELSADPKSRTQSYYADAGAALLAATLDEAPPVPEKLPALVVDTKVKRTRSTRSSSGTVDTPSSKKLPFSPMTAIGSPVEDPSVSPLTPRAGRSLDRLTILKKRSKSVGPASIPTSHSTSLKRFSLEMAPPLPTLPATVYVPESPKRPSRAGSISKTESTKDSSRRTSNSSDSSETSSQSSQPSRGPSPTHRKIRTKKTASVESKSESKPEPELEYLKPVAFQRRSTNAPIPITLAEDLPPVPVLPPQAYQFTTPKTTERVPRAELVRSSSTENLREHGTRRSAITDSKRSKSTYYPSHIWSDLDILNPLRRRKSKSASSTPPPESALPPLPKKTSDSTVDDSEKSKVSAPAAAASAEPATGSKTDETTAELDSHNPSQQPIEETEPRSALPTPADEKNPAQEPWGKGMGAEWGVAY